VTISVRKQDDISILVLEGNLVLGPPVAAFRDQIQELVEAGAKKIAISLVSVSIVDSSGIGAMVGAHTGLESVGGKCKFFGAQPRVHHALELIHMTEVFDLHPKEAAAIASFAQNA